MRGFPDTSGHLESFLNETQADLVATHGQVRTPYWLPTAKVFFGHNLNSGSLRADQTWWLNPIMEEELSCEREIGNAQDTRVVSYLIKV